MPKISRLPVSKTFRLMLAGETESEAAEIVIQQATTGANRQRNDLFSTASYVIGDADFGATEIKQKINPEEVRRKEAFLTMSGCTLCYDDGEPVFVFKNNKIAMQETEFNRVWDLLPIEITAAISNFVRQVNPQWASVENQGE